MSNPKIFLQPELIEGDNIDIAQDGKTISSNTPLENITDTEITEVEDGQALIYDETSGKWVNGEGGTPIEPNPAAAATDTLSTIKIDNTVFSIGGGGTGDAVLYPLTTAEYNALTPEQKMDENVLYLLTDGGSGGGGGTGGGFYAPDYENPETITLTPLTWVTYNVTQNGYVMVDLTAFTETGGTSVKVNGTTLNFDKVDGTSYILNSTYMFPVMVNDVVEIRLNYDGSGYGSNTALFFPAKGEGGGGSNVVPNPEDEATDVLHSIKIDDATYAIQGGGSFIDVNNRIVAPTEFTTSLTYTATEDCVVCMYLVCPGDASTFVKINDFTVQNFWQAELATGPCAPIFVRTGQTLTVTGAHTTYASNYIVYGVQSGGSGGGGTGNLNAVEMDYEDWLELPQEEREDPNIEYFLSNAPGGGGGGSGYSETTLWENTSGLSFNANNQQTVTLSDNMSNYDMLCLIYRDSTYITDKSISMYPVSEIDTAGSIGFWLTPLMPENNLTSPRSYYVSDNQVRLAGVTTRVTMVAFKIIGIKFGGGGGGSEIIPNPQGTATDTLNTVEIDGTVYDIEGGGGSNLIIDAQKYSLEEEVIGIWTDGKPLYQKTIEVSSITRNAWNSYLVDVDAVIKNIDGWYKDANNTLPLNYFNGSVMMVRTSDHADGYFSLYGSGTLATATVTVQYTKTTDTAGSGGYQAYGFTPVIYSEEEREIGVWIDNKPLYQKTVVYSSGVNIGTSATTLSTANFPEYATIDKFISGFVNRETTSSKGTASTFLGVWKDGSNLKVYATTTWNGMTHFTFQYTKTTDVAGSGEYNTMAIPNVHYSVGEQVIGTWIDGKPIYQITLELNVSLNTTSWISVNIDSFVQNIKYIMHFDAMTDDGTNTYDITGTIYELQPYQNNGTQMIDIHCTLASARTLKYLTIQYTKTTD